MDLIAKRPMTYATRRLQAGDTFTASNKNGRVLTAIGKAGFAPSSIETDDNDAATLSDLRAQYQQKFDKKAYHGWDAAALIEKLAETKD